MAVGLLVERVFSNAEGRMTKQNGSNVVEEITRVRSVDIVSDPATTHSLFESGGLAGSSLPASDELPADSAAFANASTTSAGRSSNGAASTGKAESGWT